MKSMEEEVMELIQKHADRGGLVAMQRLRRDCAALPIDGEYIDIIIGKIRDAGLVWMWGKQIIVVRPWRCPNCGPVTERVSVHMPECLRVQRKLAGYRVRLGD
jgi:hypothetical protein